MFQDVQEGVKISLFVQPNAPKSQIVGEYNNQLKIKIKAPPVDGKANEAIIEFFSELLGIPQNRVEILRGDKSKGKVILVHGMKQAQVAGLLKL